MKPFISYPVDCRGEGIESISDIHLVGEEPLSIRIQGKPYSVIMRTPGDEIAHAAGFCLGEGIVDSPDDIASIGFCDDDTNVVTITLKDHAEKKITEILDRRSFLSQTSCGICGKEVINDIRQRVAPIRKDVTVRINELRSCLDKMPKFQDLRKKTNASHAAALYNAEYKLISIAEDVGRHNALDKSIGRLFLENRLHEAVFLLLASRTSYELVQKAARAQIPIILSISRPTTIAVDLAMKLNMTLACLARDSGIYIFCGKERLQ